MITTHHEFRPPAKARGAAAITAVRRRIPTSGREVPAEAEPVSAVAAPSVAAGASTRATAWGRKGSGPVTGLLRRGLMAALRRLEGGRVTLFEGDEVNVLGRGGATDPVCRVTIHDPAVWRRVALGGSAAAGETYAQGLWDCDDPAALVRIIARNERMNVGMERGLGRLGGIVDRAIHFFRRNSRDGSRRNISAHYDVGNDFFERVLDETMMYSAGVFAEPGTPLVRASIEKIDRICRKLELSPNDHLLEIGTGWGGFAVHAASRYGCRVTTTTISAEQYEGAVRRVREAGLEDRVEVLLRDYRDLDGRYDKLVSIEMIEAVGHEYFGDFFRACGRLLDPRGLFVMQAITVADGDYERCRRNVDFIKKHVFPGCCIPSLEVLGDAASRDAGLRLEDVEDITAHYAQTLRVWRSNLDRNEREIRTLGYSEEFVRLWRFYFAYCEGGFDERTIQDVQIVWAGPDRRSGARNG